jgi:UDP-N-acetylmuramate: L-alanyl-gamma-D-glutamyl-meso-diaminopimelate ligase
VPPSGTLLLCADQPGALALRQHAYSNVETYGFAQDADWRIEAVGKTDADQEFRLYHRGESLGEFTVQLFGRYNLLNATAAIAAASIEGAPLNAIQAALPRFRGIRRRMETILKSEGITFVEDFAHHPTAVREAIAAVKERWPSEKLTVLFEPRSNTTATNVFQNELGKAFAGADEVWIGPIYRAERYAPDVRLDRDRLVADIESHGARAHQTDDVTSIVRHIRTDVAPHDIVLILSNGAFGGIYDHIRAHFSGQEDA